MTNSFVFFKCLRRPKKKIVGFETDIALAVTKIYEYTRTRLEKNGLTRNLPFLGVITKQLDKFYKLGKVENKNSGNHESHFGQKKTRPPEKVQRVMADYERCPKKRIRKRARTAYT